MGSLKTPRDRGRKRMVRISKGDQAFTDQLMRRWQSLGWVGYGVRGWCYILEGDGVITKDEFAATQKRISSLRKRGYLPVNFCGEDENRAADCLEILDDETPEKY